MQRIIISDASCLILLEKIGELDLLNKLFGKIITTQEVADEFGLPLPGWVELRHASDKNYQAIIEASVDKGEASAIALAIEYVDCLIIIDDLKARKFALQLHLNITGTLGIIVEAKRSGIIESVEPLIDRIRNTNFRITEKLKAMIIKKANE